MLLLTKKILNEYKTLILNMHQGVPMIQVVAQNLDFFCNLEVMLGLSCLMPMIERLYELIKFSQSQCTWCFVCNFILIIKL